VDQTAQNGVTYYYVVVAVDSAGETSSNEASATPEFPPAAPTTLIATSGNAQVALTWIASDPLATSYTVLRGAQSGGPYVVADTINLNSPPTLGQVMNDMDAGLGVQNSDGTFGLENGTTYYYVVTAAGVGGSSGNSNEANATPFLPIPSPVSSIRAMAGDTTVSLIWGGSQNATGFSLYRSSDDSTYSLIASLPVMDTTYSDTGLTNGTSYTYYVIGVNAAGSSLPSPTATAQPAPALSTAAAVIQAATAFCQAIGQPVTAATATTTFPRPMIGPDGEESYYLPRWSVVFPGQAEVDVVDGSTTICWYKNDTIGSLTGPAGTAESSSSALQTFNTALTASGVDQSELGQSTANEVQGDYPPSELEHYWNITAQRQYQGIPYLDQEVMAFVQAETGQLYIYSVKYFTPAPTSNVQTVTSDQAQSSALSILNSIGVQTVNFDSATLMVVQPNTLFQINGSEAPSLLGSLVVWNCIFDDGTAQGGTLLIDETLLAPHHVGIIWTCHLPSRGRQRRRRRIT